MCLSWYKIFFTLNNLSKALFLYKKTTTIKFGLFLNFSNDENDTMKVGGVYDVQ